MQISLTKPELEEFIAEQVNAGHFASPEAVIEAGLARLMLDTETEELDDATVAGIEESNAQFERGEVIDFDQFVAEMRRNFSKA